MFIIHVIVYMFYKVQNATLFGFKITFNYYSLAYGKHNI